ncbi:flagellin N-terminal helical domain-containing protein [Sulfitobacter guttiformis]|uniref:Flagellin n=1 Tax=Sulfitobacter guttiformis TaxID=74349 RepID=A0A420DS30_9RHOB|nr:flagellin [Sulfitobacter guttiformis]KIN74544.1 Flagellin domain protein [Sulfitobacter guttiformis KCTC 32187]RKE97131.1 flagellin [Sulfitobacter guttiformis]
MSSINTNNGAMVALQTLKSINANLTDTQNAISTGKDVATAKDNASVWAISKVMESDVSGLDAVTESLATGQSAVAVASAGAELIVETIKEMQALAISAQSEGANFTQIDAEMTAKKEQLDSIVAGSQFNGVNLLNTDTDGNGATGLTVVGSINRIGGGAATATTIDVASADLEATVTNITLTGTADIADAATTYTELETMLTAAITGAANLGTSAKRLDDQSDFVSKLSDSLKSGIGALVDTDMEAASAKLQALQTQQQLGVQALSIANQAPQTILSLFR